MANWNFFNCFYNDLGKGVHNLDTNTLKCYLTNQLPVATNTVKANIPGITEQNGYAEADTANTYTQSGSTCTLNCTDITWTGTGDFGPFQYAVIYNDDQTLPADPLVAWCAYSSSVTVHAGESFKIDFVDFLMQIG